MESTLLPLLPATASTWCTRSAPLHAGRRPRPARHSPRPDPRRFPANFPAPAPRADAPRPVGARRAHRVRSTRTPPPRHPACLRVRRARRGGLPGAGDAHEAAPSRRRSCASPRARRGPRHALRLGALPHKNLACGCSTPSPGSGARSPRPVLVIPGHGGRIGDELRALAAKLGDRGATSGSSAGSQVTEVEGPYGLAARSSIPPVRRLWDAAARGDGPRRPRRLRRRDLVAGGGRGRGAALRPTTSRDPVAIARLLDDPELRRDLIARGRRQVTRFSWRGCAPWDPGRLPRRPWMDGAPRVGSCG